MTATATLNPERTFPPPCIIDWSDRVARAEEDLAHAVTMTVIDIAPLIPADAVVAVHATRMDVTAESLVLRRASPSSYLLMLPDVGAMDHLVGLQQPLCSSEFSFSLLCKRWSRLAGAVGRVLPCLLDVEVCSIPAHVWETSTVEQLLCPHAWIDRVHADTLEMGDLSTFRCSAWCLDSSTIPLSRELWVAEPPTAIMEDPPVKRVLAYHVDIKTTVVIPPSPGPADGSDDSSTQRRRSILAP